MKTVLLLTTAVMIALISFAMHKPEIESEEKIALQVITALQRENAHEYSALFPTLADFHGLMMKNSELYGKNMQEAAADFQKEFEEVLDPAFRQSFQNIRRKGNELGIDWRSARLISVEIPEKLQHDYSVVPMTIRFSSGEKEHRLVVEKALLVNGHWKISHHLRLEN